MTSLGNREIRCSIPCRSRISGSDGRVVPCFHRINSANEKREATVCKPRLKGMARERLDSRIRLEMQLYGATRGLTMLMQDVEVECNFVIIIYRTFDKKGMCNI